MPAGRPRVFINPRQISIVIEESLLNQLKDRAEKENISLNTYLNYHLTRIINEGEKPDEWLSKIRIQYELEIQRLKKKIEDLEDKLNTCAKTQSNIGKKTNEDRIMKYFSANAPRIVPVLNSPEHPQYNSVIEDIMEKFNLTREEVFNQFSKYKEIMKTKALELDEDRNI